MMVRLAVLGCLALLLAACGRGNYAPVVTRGEGQPVGYYVVQAGETLYSIAWRHGLDYRAMARWNHIDPPYRIYPGQRLRLSSRGERPVAVAPPPRKPVATATRPAPSVPADKPAAGSPAPVPAAGELAWRWPTNGKLVRPFATDTQGKQGIEIGGRAGQGITAAAAGKVVYAGSGLRGYGNLVIIKHNGRYLTAYGYNQDLLVKEGDSVQAGQQIATMGLSPSRQPGLHFELRRDGKPIDPTRYLPPQ